MMTAASAMNPGPAEASLSNDPVEPTVKSAPPRPAKTPPNSTACHRTRLTLMPTVSAALGCSPTERTRRPHLVSNSRKVTMTTEAYIR